jgi:hypothetical protein
MTADVIAEDAGTARVNIDGRHVADISKKDGPAGYRVTTPQGRWLCDSNPREVAIAWLEAKAELGEL